MAFVIIDELITLFQKKRNPCNHLNARKQQKNVKLNEKRIELALSYFHRILLSICSSKAVSDIVTTYILSEYKWVKNNTVLEIKHFKSNHPNNKKHDISFKYGNNLEMKKIAMFVNKCNGITIFNDKRIKGVTIENCNNCHFIFTDIIASFQIIRSNDCIIEILNKVPTITLDYCINCTVKMNKTLLNYQPDICTSQMDLLYFEFDQTAIDNTERSENSEDSIIQCINYSSQFNKNQKEQKKYHRTIVDPNTLQIHTNVMQICLFP